MYDWVRGSSIWHAAPGGLGLALVIGYVFPLPDHLSLLLVGLLSSVYLYAGFV